MANEVHQILCIGKDSGLLRSRCAVLENAGYVAQFVMFDKAQEMLQNERFDLIILSAILNDEEKDAVQVMVGINTPIIALRKMILASDLLAEVDRRLAVSTPA